MDFYNGFVKNAHGKEGPREPWHDIHAKFEGSVAQDVFKNFNERWSKQCTKVCPAPELDRRILDLNYPPLPTGNCAPLRCRKANDYFTILSKYIFTLYPILIFNLFELQ